MIIKVPSKKVSNLSNVIWNIVQPVLMMFIKIPKAITLSEGLTKRTFFMLIKQNLELCKNKDFDK